MHTMVRVPSGSVPAGRRCHSAMLYSIVFAALVSLHALAFCDFPISVGQLSVPRQSRRFQVAGDSCIPRQNHFGWHGRDQTGVRHVETRMQGREASTLMNQLEEIFATCTVDITRIGDDEMQRRVRIDDVLMGRNCRTAYIHVSASGDKLEQRQTFVWIARNKGAIRTALAKRYRSRSGTPKLYFVESKFDKWDSEFRRARKYPELNKPDPYQADPNWIPKIMQDTQFFQKTRKRVGYDDKVKKRAGVGDESKQFPRWGYPQ
eukprot:TRINITY_DN58727_c0_g1_i1.p1 TRINITY_DN58727_c0_g1~~TRINITY_DN58727_c0_g1_i1.p1  ORF type:complete len:262 (+),score=27.68 TRINITY_DN58727_c0_g1_i1:54-839(+)